jgi:protein-tyrosine phosphatase
MRVLMVCLGNICRSPLAEGIMREKFRQKNMEGSVDSAGMINYHEGEQPDSRSIAIARKFGIDITSQRARSFNQTDIENFDLIFAMDTNNMESLHEHTRNKEEENKIQLILEYAGVGERRSVPDPYYGNLKDFENVFLMLDNACEIIANKIKKQHPIKIA